jgi:hypothetical protein
MSRTRQLKPQVLQPFSQQDLETWNEALRQCEEAMRQCELGIQAGLPCDDQLSACTALRDQIARMKQVYAPGYP